MFSEMRTAALIQKPVYGATAMPAEKVLAMATIEGAAILGWDREIGSLEPGKKADLIIINPGRPHSWPRLKHQPYADLLYQVKAEDVWYTVVDGKVLVREGRLVSIDEEHLARETDRQAHRLMTRAGLL